MFENVQDFFNKAQHFEIKLKVTAYKCKENICDYITILNLIIETYNLCNV